MLRRAGVSRRPGVGQLRQPSWARRRPPRLACPRALAACSIGDSGPASATAAAVAAAVTAAAAGATAQRRQQPSSQSSVSDHSSRAAAAAAGAAPQPFVHRVGGVSASRCGGVLRGPPCSTFRCPVAASSSVTGRRPARCHTTRAIRTSWSTSRTTGRHAMFLASQFGSYPLFVVGGL